MNKPSPPRLLVLFSRAVPRENEPACLDLLKGQLNTLLGFDVELTSASDWFDFQFPMSGTYDQFASDAVFLADRWSGEALFTAFMLVSTPIGRANGQIAALAMQQQRIVLYADDDLNLFQVTSVQFKGADAPWADAWAFTFVPAQA